MWYHPKTGMDTDPHLLPLEIVVEEVPDLPPTDTPPDKLPEIDFDLEYHIDTTVSYRL